ncbi:MAG: DegT/DnrJ/EryC1/StrS family aminotransferase [Bacteroidales bacterium]|nr:DegT/DnrJ/EryC1/StrS family aminotransferase [Acholeplasmataceae bacterium]MCK9447758.1 DegT/DnrJ/EryC1/StrS family aminotransferase [Bacteroidales bacterium]
MELNNAITSLQGYIEGCLQQPTMQHQHLSGTGATHFLEAKLRSYYNKKYALTFCNATTALQTLCLAMDLNNTEILSTPLNWGGSIAPFLFHRNKLRFTSFEPDSLNLSLKDLPSAITQNTKAVLSVDFNGTPVDSEAIKTFCLQNNLFYISDSAQSFGSYFNHKPAGYFADAIVLSFSPGKSFFAGEGGAVITDNTTIYEKLLWYSQHPSRQKTVFGISNYNEYTPINGRMNPLSVLLLNEIFEDTFKVLKKHQNQCFQVIMLLQDNNLVQETTHIPSPSASTFFRISLKLKPSSSLEQVRDILKQHYQPFFAEKYVPQLIPYETSFQNQFRRRFSCSDALIEQYKVNSSNHWLSLTYSPSTVQIW